MKHLRSTLAKLKKKLANQNQESNSKQLEIPEITSFIKDSFERELIEAGFPDKTAALKVASRFKEREAQLKKLAGNLKDNTMWHDFVRQQLEQGKVQFEYQSKLHLGRMRALVALVALREGYQCHFAKDKEGEPMFHKEFVHPAIRDDCPTIYSVPVSKYSKPHEVAFFSLSNQTRRKLLNLV